MSHPGAELFMAPLAEKMARLAAEVGASRSGGTGHPAG